MPKIIPLLLLALSFTAFADTDRTYCGSSLEDLLEDSKSSWSTSLIDVISAKFIGTPYALGVSGEGTLDVYDQDPLWRLDKLDCTTFLETVMAASISHDRASFEEALRKIRYEDGEIAYVKRNHFAEAEWVANNVRAGFVTDITATLFPGLAKTTSAVIDKPNWYAKKTANDIEPKDRPLAEREKLAAELREKASQYKLMPVTLPYLPMQAFYKTRTNPGAPLEPNPEVLSKIPNGTIFNVVREGWKPGDVTPLLISHQGFVIQKKDGTYIRHASTNKEVLDEKLDVYFTKFLESPTVRGINLLEMRGK